MKNKIIVLSLILLTLISLCSCSKSNNNSFKDNKSETGSNEDSGSAITSEGGECADDAKDTDKTKDSKDENSNKKITVSNEGNSKDKNKNKSSNVKNVEDFYGKWDVKKVEAYANDNKSSEANRNDILGKTIEFSKDKISYNGKNYDKPSYTTKEVTNHEFKKNYNKNLSDFQLENDAVQELKVGNSENIGIGNEYIWKNSDTLIMVRNGDCYELKKR